MGIFLIIVGIYGAPLSWVGFGSASAYISIVKAIDLYEIRNIDDLKNNFNKPKELMQQRVTEMIKKVCPYCEHIEK